MNLNVEAVGTTTSLTPIGASISTNQISKSALYIGHLGPFHPSDYPFVQLKLFHLFKALILCLRYLDFRLLPTFITNHELWRVYKIELKIQGGLKKSFKDWGFLYLAAYLITADENIYKPFAGMVCAYLF